MLFFKIKLLYLRLLSNPLLVEIIKSSALVFLIFIINYSVSIDNFIFDTVYITDGNTESSVFVSETASTNGESVENVKKKFDSSKKEWSLLDCFLFFIIIAFGFNALADDPWHIRCRK
jgi:hypothetical protein